MSLSSKKVTDSDSFLRKLEQDRIKTESSYQYILSTIDFSLGSQNLELLLSLIDFIENDPVGSLVLQYIGKTHRFLRILHIIELEKKLNKPVFSHDCTTAKELWDKYMLTLYAIRRILFQLSSTSVGEAEAYLKSRPISPIAAYVITQDDLIIPDKRLYTSLMSILSDSWTETDESQFLSLINIGKPFEVPI